MARELTIALSQINPVVGDLAGNADKIRAARARAATLGADLVVFSELVITGYPPEDLVLKASFQRAARAEVEALAGESGPALLLGAPWREDGALYNAALLLDEGTVVARRFKHDLPNYGVFDEKRVFAAGPLLGPMAFRGVPLGVMICEDMWGEEVAECLGESGAQILVVLNGSPFEADKRDARMNYAVARVREAGLPLIYVNQVGGQDELVFDGLSFVLNRDCTLAAQAPAWQSDLSLTRWREAGGRWSCVKGEIARHPEGPEAIYQAMMVGLRDYVEKNRFPGVVLGLSGGIDSALSAAVAVDALGPARVHCLMMPSKYTSQTSLRDAEDCAKALGVRLDSLSIAPAVGAFEDTLAPLFGGTDDGVTHENIQPRARGILLMAISNKFGDMVLTTGNKSEMSVGYTTLYGDMCGGYSVLKDVYKTTVFELSRWRNKNFPNNALGPKGEVMPKNVITKPPSAELKPDQTDQDSLPPYDVLDDILECLVEKEMAFDAIVARGHARKTVARIEHLLYVAEYKRRQAPPGVKITARHFGRDRRYPITNGFRDARTRREGS